MDQGDPPHVLDGESLERLDVNDNVKGVLPVIRSEIVYLDCQRPWWVRRPPASGETAYVVPAAQWKAMAAGETSVATTANPRQASNFGNGERPQPGIQTVQSRDFRSAAI